MTTSLRGFASLIWIEIWSVNHVRNITAEFWPRRSIDDLSANRRNALPPSIIWYVPGTMGRRDGDYLIIWRGMCVPWFLLQKGPCSLVSVSHPSGGSLVCVGWGRAPCRGCEWVGTASGGFGVGCSPEGLVEVLFRLAAWLPPAAYANYVHQGLLGSHPWRQTPTMLHPPLGHIMPLSHDG